MRVEQTEVVVDKHSDGGKWRLGVTNGLGDRAHIGSYSKKHDALTAGHILSRHLLLPLVVYTASGGISRQVTTQPDEDSIND